MRGLHLDGWLQRQCNPNINHCDMHRKAAHTHFSLFSSAWAIVSLDKFTVVWEEMKTMASSIGTKMWYKANDPFNQRFWIQTSTCISPVSVKSPHLFTLQQTKQQYAYVSLYTEYFFHIRDLRVDLFVDGPHWLHRKDDLILSTCPPYWLPRLQLKPYDWA